ncbi:hypothetical protein U1Q18_000520 [Sarracenia purpurea var. burkii]
MQGFCHETSVCKLNVPQVETEENEVLNDKLWSQLCRGKVVRMEEANVVIVGPSSLKRQKVSQDPSKSQVHVLAVPLGEGKWLASHSLKAEGNRSKGDLRRAPLHRTPLRLPSAPCTAPPNYCRLLAATANVAPPAPCFSAAPPAPCHRCFSMRRWSSPSPLLGRQP